jgi:hypothetical protein
MNSGGSMSTPRIQAPAPYVPQVAVTYGPIGGDALAVDLGSPLPTRSVRVAAVSEPLVGTATTSGTAGPFVPELGRPIWVTLGSGWTGSVQLLRSTDGGATRLAITTGDGTPKGVWSVPVNAAVTEESVAAASYWLSLTLTAGTLAFEVRQ